MDSMGFSSGFQRQLKNLNFRLFFFVFSFFLFSACQSFDSGTLEKEQRIGKILDTNIEFAQKHIDAGNPERALQNLRPLNRKFPGRARLLNMMGITYLALLRPQHAKHYFEKAYEAKAEGMYLLNLSSALIEMGAYREAQEVLRTALKEGQYPYLERLYHNYALSFEKMRQFKKAVSYYKKALHENPIYYLSSYRLGKIYKSFKKLKSAKLHFEDAKKSCRTCFEPIKELYLLEMDAGRYVSAARLLKGYLEQKDIPKNRKEEVKDLLSVLGNADFAKTN